MELPGLEGKQVGAQEEEQQETKVVRNAKIEVPISGELPSKRPRDCAKDSFLSFSRWQDVPKTRAALALARPLQAPQASSSPQPLAAAAGGGGVSGVVPTFRVGTLEMYKRFPEAYDAFMRCHNCDAIGNVLVRLCSELLLPQQEVEGSEAASSSSAPVQDYRQLDRRGRRIRVCDLGCGTGRIGTMLLHRGSPLASAISHISCYDKEVNMLKVCHRNMTHAAPNPTESDGPLVVTVEDASSSPLPLKTTTCGEAATPGRGTISVCFRPFDFDHVRSGALAGDATSGCGGYNLVTSAWALSYVVRAQWGGSKWHDAVRDVVEACTKALDPNFNGAILLVETLGTGSESPTRQCLLFDYIAAMCASGSVGGRTVTCSRESVRTDYTFPSAAEAVGMCRFFFGPKVADQVEVSGSCVLPECTAILILRVAAGIRSSS